MYIFRILKISDFRDWHFRGLNNILPPHLPMRDAQYPWFYIPIGQANKPQHELPIIGTTSTSMHIRYSNNQLGQKIRSRTRSSLALGKVSL